MFKGHYMMKKKSWKRHRSWRHQSSSDAPQTEWSLAFQCSC